MSILSQKAVLAALNVGGWNARKYDGNATAVVHEHFHAEKDSGNYNKALIDVKAQAWVRITKARTALRDFHYAHTLPWVHKGAQLLPAATYLDYNSKLLKLISEYEEATEDFIEHHYVDLKAQAKKKRNGLYSEADYPAKGDLRRRFYASVSYLPVPDAGHVIVDLQNAEVARIKRDTEAMIAQAVEQAQAELWVRLYEPVKNMAEALVDPTRRFHDTLVSNVKDIVKLVQPMNLTGDAKLAAIADEVKKALTRASADTLRTDPDKRSESAKKAAELAKKMRSLMPVQP